MNSSRIETLRRYYEEDPSDPFTIYALALECVKSDPGEAARYFEELLSNHPDYLPTYYQAGHCYDLLRQHDRAIEILEKGIAVATAANELKTRNELRTYLDELAEN